VKEGVEARSRGRYLDNWKADPVLFGTPEAGRTDRIGIEIIRDRHDQIVASMETTLADASRDRIKTVFLEVPGGPGP